MQSETWRLSLEANNKRYEYVTKATSDAIWDWDIEKGTLYWGEGFTTIFGYELTEAMVDITSWTDHIHPNDAENVINSVYEVVDRGETNWKKEYRYKRADGTYADVVDRGFVIRDEAGKAIRMVGAMHDISERKKSLAELKQFADDLYKRNRELHQFAYVVSHNLRSPVANIMGIAGLMEAERENPETIEYCVQGLKKSIASLDEVIQDLSKILSITDGIVEIPNELVDLVEIINKVKTDLHETISTTQAVVKVPEGTQVILSHKAYIYSIFYNLISNAIKYRSNRLPEVSIDIDCEPESVVIRVTDNGIGIDLKRHENDLFKPYKRFNHEKEGKGLGLFLVKSHVEALKGTIEIQSEPGNGSVFVVTFSR